MTDNHNKNLIQHQTDIKCHFIGKNHVCNNRFVMFLMTIFISALECHVVHPHRVPSVDLCSIVKKCSLHNCIYCDYRQLATSPLK